jgi:hypothetical protein
MQKIIYKSTELNSFINQLVWYTCKIYDFKSYYKWSDFKKQTNMLEAIVSIGVYSYSGLMFRWLSFANWSLSQSLLSLFALEQNYS